MSSQRVRYGVVLSSTAVLGVQLGHETVPTTMAYGRAVLQVAFAALECGFLEAYGDVGRHFYTGRGRKTERLKESLEVILRLEQRYPHKNTLAALEVAVRHGYFDAGAVEYLLHSGQAVCVK